MIKTIQNPTNNQVIEFDKFSDENWGEHGHNGDPTLDFFDTYRVIFENYNKENFLVSGLIVFFKTVVLEEDILHVVGIGGVVTHKDHRRKGYALETLKALIGYLKENKIGIAILNTQKRELVGLYSKVGFVSLNKPYYFEDSKGIRKEENGGMIANLGNTEAFNILLNTKEDIFVGRSNF